MGKKSQQNGGAGATNAAAADNNSALGNLTAKMNKQNQAKYSRSNDTKDYSSFKIVLFYCSLIVFLPVATFFLLKSWLLTSLFTISEIKSNIFSAVGAIIALHVALGFYIYRAYFGGAESTADGRKKAD